MITNIELDIKRKDVYNEVARISGYVGAKSFKEQDGQADTYTRIAITDSDYELLDRYWEDCCGKVAGELQRFIKDIVSNDKSNDATFIIQPLSDVAQRKTVLQKDLFSCFGI